MAALQIELVPCLKDNYAYLVHDADAGLTAIVDPSEPEPVRQAAAKRGWRLTHILNTHHHFDHTGGNFPLKEASGAKVVGPEKDRERIPGIDEGVIEGQVWMFGNRRVPVLEIPAHTRAHIAFIFDDAVFTGDTLFAMGCGRLFEGTPAMMWSSLSKLMALPDATRIYCGHEYTLNNGKFALSIEPEQHGARRADEGCRSRTGAQCADVPSTIGLEKATNPFLRPNSTEFRQSLGMENASDVEVFGEMRKRKDSF